MRGSTDHAPLYVRLNSEGRLKLALLLVSTSAGVVASRKRREALALAPLRVATAALVSAGRSTNTRTRCFPRGASP
jgi:hypothetical protein